MTEQETESKDIVITYDTLFEILRNEKTKGDLQKLHETFFNDVTSYLNEKQETLTKETDQKSIFESDKKATLVQSAIGPKREAVQMHVSNRDDSSSLLNIGENQSSIFPGTKEKSTEEINVAPLSHFLTKEDLIKPVFVKIDVQGFELEVLKGSKNLIDVFDYIYVECSFVELYEGQALADEVITYLANYSFQLKGVYNTFYDKKGIAVQGDFLFVKD